MSRGSCAPLRWRLGNNAESSPPSTPGDRHAARADRYRLQNTAQSLLWNEGVKAGLEYPANFHKTIKCMRVRFGDGIDVCQSHEHGTAFYGRGLVSCGKPGCPVCSPKIQERRRQEIASAFDWTYTRHQTGTAKKVIMVTLTFPHTAFDALQDLLDKQRGALTRLRKGKIWDKFKKQVGFDGLIRTLEVTHGQNGWHPHVHEAWIVDQTADASDIRKKVTDRWLKMCQKEGLVPENRVADFLEHAVDVADNCRASDYFAKMDNTVSWGMDRELAKASSKKGKKSGRSPFQILDDASGGCKKSADLYLEYVRGMKGKAQVFWSPGLKSRVGQEDKSDEEVANEQVDNAAILGLLTAGDWDVVLAHKARPYILQLAEQGGWPAVKSWLEAPEIPPDPGLKRPPDKNSSGSRGPITVVDHPDGQRDSVPSFSVSDHKGHAHMVNQHDERGRRTETAGKSKEHDRFSSGWTPTDTGPPPCKQGCALHSAERCISFTGARRATHDFPVYRGVFPLPSGPE